MVAVICAFPHLVIGRSVNCGITGHKNPHLLGSIHKFMRPCSQPFAPSAAFLGSGPRPAGTRWNWPPKKIAPARPSLATARINSAIRKVLIRGSMAVPRFRDRAPNPHRPSNQNTALFRISAGNLGTSSSRE